MNNNQFFKTSSRVIAVGLCVLSLNSIEARAEMEIMPADEPKSQVTEGTVISKKGIEALYKKSTEVMVSGGDEAVAFLDKHTHENVRNVLHMRTHFQGKPPEKRTVVSDKAALLKDTKEAYEKGSVEDVETEITSMEISEDGQSANVKEKTSSNFTLNISEKETLLIASKQNCETVIILSNEIMQTKSSECDVDVSVKQKK